MYDLDDEGAVARAPTDLPILQKSPSGLAGFDEITHGGLPRGRTTLLCGGAGCGKTLFGMQFLVRGAIDHGEPGVFIAFEESTEDLAKNVASLGFDLDDLCERGLLYLDHVRVERNEIEESGEYDLDGLFIRLELALASVGAKRIVIDTLETLFGGLSNHAILRSELRRLFNWLKEKEVTAIVTAERGDGTLTRHGLEEYVSDCVILLDHRVNDQVSTRRLRVVKYRGSTHGTNEYPFLIDSDGISVVPITGAALEHEVTDERVSSGVPRLDAMLAGGGYYRGSTVLITGTAGSGKSSLASHFADAVCSGGERCLFFSFEESPAQIKRNMRSIGLDLQAHEDAGLLRFAASRPTMYGLEMHLAVMHKAVASFRPAAVIVDPIGNLMSVGGEMEAHLMLVRLIDFLKANGVTALLTSLTGGGEAIERTDVAVSSIVDTWLLVKNIELDGERNRGLYVLKSRGMAHSNQVREFLITPHGVDLVDVYVGPGGVLTGSARVQQEAREEAARLVREREIDQRKREIDRKRAALEADIEARRAEFEAEALEIERLVRQSQAVEDQFEADRKTMARMRGVPTP